MNNHSLTYFNSYINLPSNKSNINSSLHINAHEQIHIPMKIFFYLQTFVWKYLCEKWKNNFFTTSDSMRLQKQWSCFNEVVMLKNVFN